VSNQIPRKKKKDEWKVHDTGCGRTEGYYKVDSKQKANHKVNIALPKFILNKGTCTKNIIIELMNILYFTHNIN